MAQEADSTGTNRLVRLDGLRAIAACGVAFTYHVRTLYVEGTLDTGNAAIDWFHWSGWLFVDMFFLLSGYIFAHVYLGRGLLHGGRALADFAVARIARLYPLHLVMLLVTAALFWDRPANTALAFGAHLTMLQAFAEPVARTFDGPTWSLSIEAVCYVLFALSAAAGPRALRLVTAFAIALGIVMIAANAAPEGPYARDNFPRGLLGFFLGQVLWHQRAWFSRVPAWLLGAGIVAGLLIPPALRGAILPLALLSFPAALLLGLRMPWLESRPLAWLGDRSYAIYLVHMPLIELFLKFHAPLGGSAPELLLGHGIFIATVLVLSDIAFRRIEKPARRAIRTAWEQREAQPAIA